MSKKPLVYIITINWNGINDTIECLESLKKITYKNYKIILVDNNSKDNQAEKLKKQFPYIKLVKNSENTGFCIANNQGMELALKDKADYALLLNNDTTVAPDFLDILIDYSEKHQNIGITSPKILWYNSNLILSMGGNISYLLPKRTLIGKGKKSTMFKKNIEPDFVSGCALLIKSEVIEKIGMLDPVFFAYYEDVDISYRARRAGYKIVVLPKSVIWHKKSASTGYVGANIISDFQMYQSARNAIIFMKKNLSNSDKVLFFIDTLTLKFIYVLINCRNKKNIYKFFLGVKDGLKYKNIA